jgi:hypothetical protein
MARRETAAYDVGRGTITCRLPKKKAGQHFGGLDMLTSLLAKPDKPARAALGRLSALSVFL